MTITSSFVLLLALLACDAHATPSKCPDPKVVKPKEPTECTDDSSCKEVQHFSKGGKTVYWCEWARMVVAQNSGEWKNVKYVECDESSGVLHETRILKEQIKIEEPKKIEHFKSMNCDESSACAIPPDEINKKNCHRNDCKAADKAKNFLSCEDKGYQLESFDEKNKLWVDRDMLYCVDYTILGQGLNRPFRCRKKRDKICSFDEYYDDNECPATSICVKPSEKGLCTRGNLKFFAESWRDETITCGDKNPNQWMMSKKMGELYKKMPMASPVWIACMVEDDCDKSVFNAADNVIVASDKHSLSCAAGHDLELKSSDNNWHYQAAAMCFAKAIHPLVNGKPNSAESYSSARCRLQRACTVPNNYFDNACDQTQVCKKPADDFTCSSSNIQYTSELDPAKWITINSVKCENKQARLTIGDKPSTLVPHRIRCMKEKGCDLQYFKFGTECSDDLICEEPTQTNTRDLKCGDEFGMQAKVDNTWIDINSASCVGNKFKVVNKKGQGIAKFAIAFRCVHKNIDKFYESNDCTSQDCKKPIGCKEMKCEDQLTLVMKFTDGKWNEVQSASCNSATFQGKVNGNDFDESTVGVKCARHKCSQCQNPCPSCLGSIFTDKKKWNECTEFSCGPNSRSIFDSQKYDNAKLICDEISKKTYWKVATHNNVFISDVKCEKLCTLSSPLTTFCHANDNYCEEAKPDNNEIVVPCKDNTKTMFYVAGNAGPIQIEKLQCDKTDGEWRDKINILVPKDSNVHCHYGCNYKFYYKEQCDAENDCGKLNKFNDNQKKCIDDYGLQVDFGVQIQLGWINVQSLTCEKNRFKAKNDQDINAFPYGIRCIRKILANFFDGSDCEDAVCTPPTNCAPIKCDAMSSLRIKSGSIWKEVDSARCDSDKFSYKEKGTTAMVSENSVKVKCVRMKCTLCENPCPTCKTEFNALFSKSTKWNECAKFECGKHTRTIFPSPNSNPETRENAKLECVPVENGQAIWKMIGEDLRTEKVTCEKLCTLINILDKKCDPNDFHCIEVNLEDDQPIACPNKLFFTDDQTQMIETSELNCDKEEGAWKAKIEGKAKKSVLKQGSKVYCHFGCDIQKYFNAILCPDKSECKEPKLSPEPHCEKDFGLQVKFDKDDSGDWTDISKVACTNNQFQVFDHSNQIIAKFPYNFRCIKKKIESFFTVADCDDKKDCKEPINCASLKCEDQWALQISNSVAAPVVWEVVDSIRCDSHEFKSKDFKVFKIVTKIRCVRHKCSQCGNPCETCLSNAKLPGAKYKKSTKWDECSEFTCGDLTRSAFDEISGNKVFYNAKLVCNSLGSQGTIWNIGAEKYETKNVECQNSCKLHQPLTSECTPKDFCENWSPEDGTPNNCNLKMFYKSEASGLVSISNLRCNFVDGSWEATREDNGKNETILKDIPISCHAGCQISHYFKACEAENDCREPTKSSDETLLCNANNKGDFGLQVNFGPDQTPSDWQDVSSVKCEGHRFKAYDKESAEIAAFPKGIRCIRKNVKHFFKQCDAETEFCEFPKNCSSLECDTQFALQMEFDVNKWDVVESARCDSHEFSIKSLNGEISRARQPKGVRCIRLQCSYCTNPCPNCHPNSSALYTQPSKWNQCAEFTCGDHASILTNEETKGKLEDTNIICKKAKSEDQYWTSKDGVEHKFSKEVTCENSCALKSPLKSICNANETTCEEINLISPPNVIRCNRKMFYVPVNGAPEEVREVTCKADEGIYIATRANDEEVVVPAGSNIYCHAGDCDINRIFPECQNTYDDGDFCDEFLNDGKFYCKDDKFSFWSRHSPNEQWKSMGGVKELYCKAGNIVFEGKSMDYDFQAQCRKPVTAKQVPTNWAPLYYIVTTLILIISALAVASVMLRVLGEGWLHTIIIKKIREKEKRRKRLARMYSKWPKTPPKTPRSQPPSSEGQSPMPRSKTPRSQPPSSEGQSAKPRMAPSTDTRTPIEKKAGKRPSHSPSSDVTSEEPRSIMNEDPNVLHI